jgi:hypothetical protein
MSSERIHLDRAQVLVRVRRFNSLRAALRAIVPSVRSPEELPSRSEFQRLLDRLQPLHEETRPGGAPSAELSRADLVALDEGLQTLSTRLRAALGEISLPQLRATLGDLEGDPRREAVALLDLCLEDEPEIDRWLPVVDLLITRLATAEVDGLRSVVADPADLSPLLRELCTRSEARNLEEQTAAITFFCDAADRIRKDESIKTLLHDVYEQKQRLGLGFFATEVLRCIVFYNVNAGNQRAEALRQARSEDMELEAVGGDAKAAPQARPSRKLSVPRAAGAPTVFDSYGLDALEEACARRFSNGSPLPGAAGEAADTFVVQGMNAFESETFLHFSNDPLPSLIRRVVTVGLVLQHLEEVTPHLKDLEIDSEVLTRNWISELGAAVQLHIDECIADGGYEQANRLSDLKTRFLYGKLSALRRESRDEGAPAASAPAAAEGPGFLRSMERPPREPGRAREAAPAPKSTRAISLRTAALTVLLLVLCGYTTLQFLAAREGAVRVLPAAEVAQLSPFLLSGYRSDEGRGDVFIGSVDENWWEALEPSERATLATDLAERLRVRELQLFDRTHSLRARWVSGELTLPGGQES